MLRSNPRVALSLDFREERFLGDRAMLEDARRWPQRVIVMTLARVGAGKGPDVSRLADIVSRAQGRRVYAAGGVRNAHDLDALEAAGAAGALVATALHEGRLTSDDLARRETK
jgi:phosphoribosylformimino-5-aminoimidazole carboxamide ribotide isomerase